MIFPNSQIYPLSNYFIAECLEHLNGITGTESFLHQPQIFEHLPCYNKPRETIKVNILKNVQSKITQCYSLCKLIYLQLPNEKKECALNIAKQATIRNKNVLTCTSVIFSTKLKIKMIYFFLFKHISILTPHAKAQAHSSSHIYTHTHNSKQKQTLSVTKNTTMVTAHSGYLPLVSHLGCHSHGQYSYCLGQKPHFLLPQKVCLTSACQLLIL